MLAGQKGGHPSCLKLIEIRLLSNSSIFTVLYSQPSLRSVTLNAKKDSRYPQHCFARVAGILYFRYFSHFFELICPDRYLEHLHLLFLPIFSTSSFHLFNPHAGPASISAFCFSFSGFSSTSAYSGCLENHLIEYEQDSSAFNPFSRNLSATACVIFPAIP